MTAKSKRPACVCGDPFLVHIPEWVASPCSRCECRDYRPAAKVTQ